MRNFSLHPPFLWHSYLFIAIFGTLAAVYPVQMPICAGITMLLDRRMRAIQRLIFAWLIFLVCSMLAQWQFARIEQTIISAPEWINKPSQRVCGEVKYTQGLPNQRLRIIIQNLKPESGPPLAGYCAWTWDEPQTRPMPGQNVCITRTVKPVSGFMNEKRSSYKYSLMARDILWRLWSKGAAGQPQISGEPDWAARLRNNLYQKFLHFLNPEARPDIPQAKAILPALLFGDRFYLNQNTLNHFAAAALAHSLALSGQHLGVAGLIGYFIIILTSFLKPRIFLSCPRMLLVAITSLPLALLYLFIGNAPPSLQRATAMLFVVAYLLWQRKLLSGMDILCCALLILVILNPLAFYSIGLQFSALCVAIIVITAPMLNAFLHFPTGRQPTLKGKICWVVLSLFLLSLIIQIALLPISLSQFQQAGIWFPLNMIWLPLLGFITLPMSVAALLCAAAPLAIFQQIASFCIDVAALPCSFLLFLLDQMAKWHLLVEPQFLMPHWSAAIAFGLLILALAWLLSKKHLKQIAVMILCGAIAILAIGPALRLYHYPQNLIRITALDVGQGESLLVDLPGKIRLLMDGGGSYYGNFDPGKFIVAPQAAHNFAPAFGAIFNSHPDLDHLGGLFHIIDKFSVEKIFHNGRPAQKKSEDTWRQRRHAPNARALAAGDKIQIGDANSKTYFEILHPPPDSPQWQGNGASIVARLVRDGKGLALFTGDADKAAQRLILAQNYNIQADIVIAPHHGSDKDLLPDFYRKAAPKLVIACCGYLNFRHYPGKEVQKFLATLNCPLLDTGNHGKITVEIDKDGGLVVDTAKHK